MTTHEEAAGRVLFERLGPESADARVWTEHARAALEAADLPSLIEENERLRAAYDEVEEKIAFLRRGCQVVDGEELRRRISAVGPAEWKQGYYWNRLVREERDRAVEAQFAQRGAEAERDAEKARADRLADAIREARDIVRPGASVPLGVSEARHVDRLLAESHRILTAALQDTTPDTKEH